MKISRQEYVDQIVELAQLAEHRDPIDWGMLSIKEVDSYQLMANSVIDQMHNVPPDQREIVMMSTITKLLVENFVLELQKQLDTQIK